ncbi:MAG: rhodanese-related sulfurtransferase [Deltaproteobacteria bacterium]|jgi:UPF0176 protein|nr:rhodanese-related sulfurtransferase [Deltaproteobacteria bacterium]MBT6491982.1 rhodanese-related sulfurtransferase [Deltaproteobacteria bacterium]
MHDTTVVAALYHFARLEDFEDKQAPLLVMMKKLDVRGTLLLAREGINGTVSGSRESIDAMLTWLKEDPRLANLTHKESYCDAHPFYRTKVKLKKEIVTMGVEDIDPNHIVGTYVRPEDWNGVISDPEVVLIDTRNDYEVDIGTFKGALNPDTTTFREFPAYVEKNLDPTKHKKVAMFCTGGIRCEKSTAYLKGQGFENVYHLQGGILKYLEEVPKEESLWEGECFVFDNRVAVNHDLEAGSYDQCHACRHPVSASDLESEHYSAGISCPHCVGSQTEKTRNRAEERQKQMLLAKERGDHHIGDDAAINMMDKAQNLTKEAD